VAGRTMREVEGSSMPEPILVAYTTRTGSTAEVAQAIGASLQNAGLSVEVTPMRSMKSIGERTAVVLGAPLYAGRLPGDFNRFLSRNKSGFAAAKVWVFVLGPTERKPEQFTGARAQAEKVLAKFAWFQPAELQVFGGKFDPDRMPFPFNLVRNLPAFPLRNAPATDIRDWDAIRAWASQIARQLRPAA